MLPDARATQEAREVDAAVADMLDPAAVSGSAEMPPPCGKADSAESRDGAPDETWKTPEPAEPAALFPVKNALEPETSFKEPHYGTTLADLLERLTSVGRRKGLEPATLKQYAATVRLFRQLTGVTDIRDIRQLHLSRFVDLMAAIPKVFGKRKGDDALGLDDILERANRLPKSEIGLSAATMNRHLGNLERLIARASLHGIELPHRLQFTGLKATDKRRARDRRSTFTDEEVRRLFGHTIW
ncbi:hypothetical protein [Pseudoroseicyclus tamaricis]|uniref:Core-binding (CB) domain-containing protein n=1 Tax=Pseudoroseicyclus tamaricis TaxID=2705421 RepID=A0A6B2JH60_9RHOB|nr:hypothetical protein [Pseudoroseicyclus tamaricis]NDV00591.1 hypothetical protein [Pseudoroseicyclus tamaricis]